MYRFLLRPRWILFHVAVALAIVVMINLGFWQLRRLDDRRAFNDDVRSRINEQPLAIGELVPSDADVGDDVLDDVEWRPVTVAGEYLDGEELRVVNRSQGGRAGENVVTPLQLADGRVVLVVRGFVPLATDVPEPPSGEVDITGRLRQSQVRRTGQLTDVAEGELTEVQRLDIPRLEPQLPGDAVPMYVELTASQPAEDGPLPEPVAAPELTEGTHLSYAVQWFLFSGCAAAGWVLAVRRSIGRRRTIAT